jgi:hypothetical protein
MVEEMLGKDLRINKNEGDLEKLWINIEIELSDGREA